MFALNKKNVVRNAVFVLSILLLAGSISFLNRPVLSILKYPLNIIALFNREIKGIIFYHWNMIQSEMLAREVDLLKKKLVDFKEVALENRRLLSLLSLKQQSSYKVISARVIGSTADSLSSGVIIDKGRANGIKCGYVAINYLGLVGRVVEVSDSTSKIMLILDPSLGVSAMVQRSRQEGLVSGSLSGSLVMRYLPKDSDITISDTVITSGLTALYPKGVIIGKVISLGEEFSGLSRYAVIRPAVNLSLIEEVLIIIP